MSEFFAHVIKCIIECTAIDIDFMDIFKQRNTQETDPKHKSSCDPKQIGNFDPNWKQRMMVGAVFAIDGRPI